MLQYTDRLISEQELASILASFIAFPQLTIILSTTSFRTSLVLPLSLVVLRFGLAHASLAAFLLYSTVLILSPRFLLRVNLQFGHILSPFTLRKYFF